MCARCCGLLQLLLPGSATYATYYMATCTENGIMVARLPSFYLIVIYKRKELSHSASIYFIVSTYPNQSRSTYLGFSLGWMDAGPNSAVCEANQVIAMEIRAQPHSHMSCNYGYHVNSHSRLFSQYGWYPNNPKTNRGQLNFG